jgi:hypothetical protein
MRTRNIGIPECLAIIIDNLYKELNIHSNRVILKNGFN